MERWAIRALAVVSLLVGCAGDEGDPTGSTGSTADDRTTFHDEVDGVRAEVADCFVVEVDGARHLQATVEVRNGSDTAQTVMVTVSSSDGAETDGAAVEVAAGASDAWAVTASETTDAALGDIDCVDAVVGITVTVEPVSG